MRKKAICVCGGIITLLVGCSPKFKAADGDEDVVYACIDGVDCDYTGGAAGSSGTGGDETGGSAGNPGSGGDSGSGGSSGSSAGSSGTGGDETGGSAGDSGTGGNAGSGGSSGSSAGSSGTGGSAGDSGTGGNAGTGGTPDPCREFTADEAADLLAEPCANIFISGCGSSDSVTRGEFLAAAAYTLPEAQLGGFTAPTEPSFADVDTSHESFTAVEEFVWLKLVSDEPLSFQPSVAAQLCWAEPIAVGIGDLPDVYSVIENPGVADSLPQGWFWATNVTYHVYGTSLSEPLEALHVVQNVSGAFSDPEYNPFSDPENNLAVNRVQLRCTNSAGNTDNQVVMTGGVANFSSLEGCYADSDDPLTVRVQFEVASDATAGTDIRMAINPNTLPLRGGRLDEVVTFITEE